MNRSILVATVVAIVAVLLTTLVALGDADAKRLGGGKTLGTQRQSVAPPSGPAANPVMPAQPGAAAAKAASATPPPSGASRWLGPIAGIAAGLGLAALLSHFGLPEGFASFLLLGLLVFGAVLVFRMLMARRTPALATSPRAGGVIDATPTRIEPAFLPSAATAAAPLPPGFDATGFLREANIQFRRLQAAWDAGDRKTLGAVMTDAMASEIERDLEQRGVHEPTEIITLNAELLEVTTDAGMHWASVRFTGSVREDGAMQPTPLDEVWTLSKPVDGSSGWLLAGIRQPA